MTISLKHFTPLWVGSEATRTCWASQGKSDTKYVWECSKCRTIIYEHEDDPILDESRCPSCNVYGLIHRKETGADDKALIDRIGINLNMLVP